MRRRIMFLDFDGCCNSLEEGSYRTNGNETYGPSERICGMISDFCRKNGVGIVISSNWRKFTDDGCYSFDGNTVSNPLPKLRKLLGDLVVGTLTKERHIRKSECTILWFEDNGDDFDYVIFDDDPSEGFGTTEDFGIRRHFILTDGDLGITEENLAEAGTILNVKSEA